MYGQSMFRDSERLNFKQYLICSSGVKKPCLLRGRGFSRGAWVDMFSILWGK